MFSYSIQAAQMYCKLLIFMNITFDVSNFTSLRLKLISVFHVSKNKFHSALVIYACVDEIYFRMNEKYSIFVLMKMYFHSNSNS